MPANRPALEEPAVAALFGADPDQFTVAFLCVMLLYAGLCVVAYAMWAGAVSVGARDQSFADYTDVLWPYLPALLCYLGFTAVLYAWFPRATALGWLLLAYTFVLGMFGGLIENRSQEAH